MIRGLSQIPTPEPTLAQLDEWGRDQLIETCYSLEKVKMEDGTEGYVKVLKYPDIIPLIVSIGHLEGTSHYTWEQSQYMFFDWEALEWDPIRDKYERDAMATTVIYAIKGIKRREIFGDSQGGSKQRFVVQLSGGDKVFRLLSGSGEDRKKKGFFGLF